jgi:hypothetical protein
VKQKDLLKKKNVVAVIPGHKLVGGIDTGRDAIVVYVTKKVPLDELSAEDIVPKTVEGFESDVQISGPIRALALDRTSKWRPAPGGVSIGHPLITAGTLGMIVKKNGARYILSNNHVLANSNNASMGDQTWQPGSYDGGAALDTIGHLSNFPLISFVGDESNCPIARGYAALFNFFAKLLHRKSRQSPTISALNKVDCAISLPLDDADVSEEILEIGKPVSFNLSDPQIGAAVKKSGRTSGVNQGTVIGTNGIAQVNYDDSKVAVFEDQIFTTAIAQGGDSGSVVLNDKNEVIGLLFAGSDTLTIVNKITNVIAALELDKG